MDFTLTDEQELLRDTARSLLAKECPPSLVRAHIDDPAAADPLWTAPARVRRARRRARCVDLCLFLEEPATSSRPGPFFATAALFAPLLAASGEPPAPCSTARRPARSRWRARRRLGAERRPGARPSCPRPTASTGSRVVIAGPTVAVVDASTPSARPVETLDLTRPMFEVDVADGRSASSRSTPTRSTRRRSSGPRSALAAELVGHGPLAVRHDASPTPRSGCSSACRSARSRRSSTSSPTWRSTSSERGRGRVLRGDGVDADDPDRHRAVHVAKAAAGAAATRGGQGRHPDPRRHRLHVGARPAPATAPGLRRRAPARHHRLAPRPPRRPAPERGDLGPNGRDHRLLEGPDRVAPSSVRDPCVVLGVDRFGACCKQVRCAAPKPG